ncbi:MAG: hypothetical protein R3B51_00140 [Thermodesulfobacteriota bacterium]
MDERYFIFWDDMDWGLIFKRSGFKVVCAVNSVVYHEAFTEKRGNARLLLREQELASDILEAYRIMEKDPSFYKYLRRNVLAWRFLASTGTQALWPSGSVEYSILFSEAGEERMRPASTGG